MTAADVAHQEVVRLLDFDSYKELVRGLTQFGDRQQGTARNAGQSMNSDTPIWKSRTSL